MGEKLQTVLVRGILNTRMRDFYDIYVLLLRYEHDIDKNVFKQAFETTCKKRNSIELFEQGTAIINNISGDEKLISLWKGYQKKYLYASEITFEAAVESMKRLYALL